MAHCDPGPPHPPPGELYQVVCPPLGGWVESLALFGMLFAALAFLIWLFGTRHTTPHPRE